MTIAGVGHEDNPASNTIIQAENGKKTKPIIDITSGNTVVKNLQVKGANENAGIDDRGTGIKIGGSTDISQVILENIASNENWFGLNIAPDHSCISDVNANGIKISNSVGSGVNTLTMHGSITDVHLDGAKISGSGVNGINAAIGYESSISGLSLDGAQISNSGGNGIYAYAVSGSSISNVNLADTTISESGLTGVVVREYSDSTIWNINLKGAMITGSGKSGTDEIDKCGIFFYSADGGPISNVNLDSATISRSKGDGVYAGTHGSGSISDVRMNGGKITSNGGYGLFANGDVSFVVFNKDNIYGNNEGGVYNQCSHTIDARANWWGAPNGPSGGVTDPITGISANGAGDSVSINVWFDPWSQWLFP